MQADIELLEGESYIVVRPAVDVERVCAREFCRRAIAASAKSGRTTVLIDLHERRSLSTLADKFNFASQDAAELGLNRLRRVAVCSNAPLANDLDFLEVAMRNRGHDWRIFMDRASAVEWLMATT